MSVAAAKGQTHFYIMALGKDLFIDARMVIKQI